MFLFPSRASYRKKAIFLEQFVKRGILVERGVISVYLVSVLNFSLTTGVTQLMQIQWGESKKFTGNPKTSLQLQCNSKISAHLILESLYMNIKYPEIMEMEVRIALSESRSISPYSYSGTAGHGRLGNPLFAKKCLYFCCQSLE